MQLAVKTILNLKEKHPLFVYKDIRLNETSKESRIEVTVKSRKGSQGICAGCGARCPGYDRLAQREFIHVPIYGLAVVFLYGMRRLECATCERIVVEAVPSLEYRQEPTDDRLCVVFK